MWGNALGWCISAVIVVLTVALVAWLDVAGQRVSPQTSFSLDGANNVALELPVSAATVLPSMTDPTDGGETYHRAIETCLKDIFTYRRFAQIGQIKDIEKVPAIDILSDATNSHSADLFASHPTEIVNYSNDKPPLDALRTLANCARRVGQLIEKDQPQHAMKLYNSVFSLGFKLYQERLTCAELDAGLTLMAETCKLIGPLATSMGDPSRGAAVQAFDEARRGYYRDHILPIQSILSTVDQATLEQHAGDSFFYARHANERMWRVEAILSLGRYRFNSGRAADQRSAMTVINELCNDPDPVVQTAAKAARDLTIEEYRMMR